jgi:hypothetical protein
MSEWGGAGPDVIRLSEAWSFLCGALFLNKFYFFREVLGPSKAE